jgi:lysine-specific demethylase 8
MPAQVPPERLYTVWAWLGGPGARTWLHYDNNGCHNLNAQLTGEKTCVLFAPEHLARLKPFPPEGANPAHNCSQLDIDEVPADIPRITARLEAGDLLFIPALWLHAFHHLGELNTNVNWWWKP